jgi:hypothetical protein
MEHTDTVHTSQKTHYVSYIEKNRLILFRETVAVYCENNTEHTDTFRTSQETNTLRLLYRDKPVNTVWGNSCCLLWEQYGAHRYRPHLTGITLRLHYRDQRVNTVRGNSCCLLWEPYGTQRCSSYLTGHILRLHYRSQEPYETHRYSPYLTENTLCLLHSDQPVNAVWGNIAVYLRTIRNTQIQSVPHWKHITSPLQSPTG